MSQHDIVEIEIEEIHNKYKNNTLTCVELIKEYRDRVKNYDRSGPDINAFVTLNPNMETRAQDLDDAFDETDEFVGPLHGIPVLLKDQAETSDIETSFGSVLFEEYKPESDATIIRQLRDSGAVIVGKTNMPDWASTWIGYSSVNGRTKNPYALDRDPGGSSSGTAAGVAANFGTIGVGEDTGGSVRVPAAFNNLFGIRVTTGLISRTGASPLVPQQDTFGPITRTMSDLAKLLDVMVGYDPSDPYTSANEMTDVESYTDYLHRDGLDGKRIGVLRECFGPSSDPTKAPVTEAVDETIDTIRSEGAEIIDPVSIPEMDDLIDDTVLYLAQSKKALNDFFESRPESPVDSVQEIYDSGEYHNLLNLFEEIVEDGLDDPESDLDYWRKVATRQQFQRSVLSVFADHDLDALLYPSIQTLPPTDEGLRAGEWEPPTNPLIAPQSNCPAISVPTELIDGELPAGTELMGKPFSEPQLLEMGYAYEQAFDPRTSPSSTPPL